MGGSSRSRGGSRRTRRRWQVQAGEAGGLIVAIAASNAFLLPTHQVNALLMGPGGYRVAGYLRAGLAMSALFLVVLVPAVNLFT